MGFPDRIERTVDLRMDRGQEPTVFGLTRPGLTRPARNAHRSTDQAHTQGCKSELGALVHHLDAS